VKQTQYFFLASTLVVSLVIGQVCLANHIDFISDAGFLLSASATTGPQSATQVGAGGNIIGAEREVMISTSSGNVTAEVNAPAGPGPVGPNSDFWLQFSNSISSAGQMMLTFDGVGGAGLGGLDFDTNWNFFSVDFVGVQGTGDVTVAATDTNGNSGAVTKAVSAVGALSFGFTSTGYAGVDFTSLDSVKVTLQSTELASDFGIGSITREAVPEPASVGLLVLACLGAFGFRRAN